MSPPEIKFGRYGEPYATKPDFARVEHEFPLSLADLAKLTPETLGTYNQEQIDQIYARLAAGAIPDGWYDGGPFFPKGASGANRITGIISGFPGMVAGAKTTKLELLGKYLWHGKVFHRDSRLVRSRIDDRAPLEHLISGDPATIPTIMASGREQWLLFPARLYCGQSLLDSRRESIIIDYSHSDDIPGYRELPDYLPGRRGMQVRDEIRMIRPGFYLGRAYLGKIFLLNFTLYDKELAERHMPGFLKTGATRQDCWPGEQARQMFPGRER
ncbi:MAG: hypothetical protein L0H75_00380 [Nitrosospira sp.]|nr:hypothetical protein [Nitrosospira sp.]